MKVCNLLSCKALEGEYIVVGKETDRNDSRPSNSKDILWGGGICYTLNSRDYKGVIIVVLSKSDRKPDGK